MTRLVNRDVQLYVNYDTPCPACKTITTVPVLITMDIELLAPEPNVNGAQPTYFRSITKKPSAGQALCSACSEMVSVITAPPGDGRNIEELLDEIIAESSGSA